MFVAFLHKRKYPEMWTKLVGITATVSIRARGAATGHSYQGDLQSKIRTGWRGHVLHKMSPRCASKMDAVPQHSPCVRLVVPRPGVKSLEHGSLLAVGRGPHSAVFFQPPIRVTSSEVTSITPAESHKRVAIGQTPTLTTPVFVAIIRWALD